MDELLMKKLDQHFPGLVVDKRQALQAGFELMPRFVTEYLLAAARDRNGSLGIQEVRERIRRFSVDADRRGEFISRLMRDKEARLIAMLEVEPRPERNEHIGRIMELDGHELSISDELVAKYPELLYGGLWGTCALFYDTQGYRPRILVTDFSPYQLTRPDMNLFRRGRAAFTFEEWLHLLLQSAGYKPDAFPTLRQKLLVLSRLVPLAQCNVNLIELGPRGTGKSYLLRNLTSRAYLLAGARATPASLLYDLHRRSVGIVGRKKVVVFDEIGATSFPDVSLVAAMKDYMESGNIARGGRQISGDCSLLFTGNIDLEPDGLRPSREYLHLFEVLPYELCDSAVADRFHGFIPGWELPKISDDVIADGPGLLSDYFGEALCELRKDLAFNDYVKTLQIEGATRRDRVAIEKVSAGLLKILFPDGRVGEGALQEVLSVAVELRMRVHSQLERMAPGEFRPKSISFPGMPPLVAADLSPSTHLEEHDVEANQKELVGKVTLLFVSDRGGGDVGFVECALVEGSGLSITGLRGEVLDQSVRAAYNALLNLSDSVGLNADALRRKRMTVHLVNIAEPKDGPSAGVAFALAMLSAATGRRVRKGLAVTGELSLHGNISGVGGITEKVSAAHRHGRSVVVIPSANAAELARVPDIAGLVDVRPVQTLKEAVTLALGE